jgi:hypothetical protein
VAFLPSEKPWTKAYGEGLNADFEEFSDDEVPKLVQDNRSTENENESENSNNAIL